MKYVYQAIPFRGKVQTVDIDAVAKQLNDLINVESAKGWEFYQINSVSITVSPGCLASLFGAKGFPMSYDMAIFRKEFTPQESSITLGNVSGSTEKHTASINEYPESKEKIQKYAPTVEKLERLGYTLINSKVTVKSEFWEFEFKNNGSKFSLQSGQELIDFAKNF